MAADKNDDIESEDTKKLFLQLQEGRGSKYLRKAIDLLAEKATIYKWKFACFRASDYRTEVVSRDLTDFTTI